MSITKVWHRDTKWANVIGKKKKNDANRFAQHRVTTKVQFVKHRWYLWSITKQNKIKWGMPACDKDTHTHTHTHVWAQWKNQLNRLAGV